MQGQLTGEGQVYMATYRDGDWLDGGTNYTLHVLTVYDVATRCITVNNTKLADRSSRMDLLENSDGSVTLYIGPDKPAGEKAKNWIETLPGKGWFAVFYKTIEEGCKDHFTFAHYDIVNTTIFQHTLRIGSSQRTACNYRNIGK